MKYLTVVMVLVATVTARPDGPVGHHGVHHGVHHGAHQVVHHGAVHHATHGVHHAPSHHVQSPFHTVHSVQPIHTPVVVHHPSVVAPVVVKNSPKSIAELVSTNPKFSTLLAAVKAAGLVDTLAGPGPFTVFAPTNTAFEKVSIFSKLKIKLKDHQKSNKKTCEIASNLIQFVFLFASSFCIS